MTQKEKDLIRENSSYLCSLSKALGKIYLSSLSWDYTSIVSFYAYLKQVESLDTSEALEMLLPQ